MFRESLNKNNAKLLNLANALENKDEILNQLRIRLISSISILSIICIASIVCIVIDTKLIIPMFISSASIYLIASIILLKSKLIDVDNIIIIGMIYVLVYLCMSCMLVGCNNPLISNEINRSHGSMTMSSDIN